MAEKIDNRLDHYRIKFIQFFIRVNGYQVAAVILGSLAFGAWKDPENVILTYVQTRIPFLSTDLWGYVFFICAVFMWRCKSGKYEIVTVLGAFVLPLLVLYGVLLGLRVNSPRTSIFTNILIMQALVIPIMFTVRTSAFNYYREAMISLATENDDLERKIEKLEGQLKSREANTIED